jgi:hypothetical protein
MLAPHLQKCEIRMTNSGNDPRVLTGTFGRPAVVSEPAALLERLDGTAVTSARQTWLLEVYSVSDAGGWRWVQLGLRGDPPYSLIVRMAPTEGSDHIVEALEKWLAKPSLTERIVGVA